MTSSKLQCAAQYIRMSTDHQDLSPEMQMQAIAAYAASNHIAIVETYLDSGKSGLSLESRSAMKKLLVDVTDPDREYSIVLVYDVSRWGRFQDMDASGYWEYHCLLHGVELRYVNELFTGDVSILAWMYKSMKRGMASEFSRELSVKVRAAQHAAVKQGLQLGPLPCLGFTRIAVSKSDGSVRKLALNERKAGNREHTKWIPGPKSEVEAVRRIFETYAYTDIQVKELADKMTAEGLRTQDGRPITPARLYSLFKTEAFTGDFVWGRDKDHRRRKAGDPGIVRVVGALEPLISKELYAAVQRKARRRNKPRNSTAKMVDSLKTALAVNPMLAARHLKAYGCAHEGTYRQRFGSVQAAWEAAGIQYRDPREVDLERRISLTTLQVRICAMVVQLLRESGTRCTVNSDPQRYATSILIADRVLLRIQVVRRAPYLDGEKWFFKKVYWKPFDWIFVVREESDGKLNDSLLLRRDEYFLQPLWLGDDLEVEEGWIFNQSTAEVARLLSSLEPVANNTSRATRPSLARRKRGASMSADH